MKRTVLTYLIACIFSYSFAYTNQSHDQFILYPATFQFFDSSLIQLQKNELIHMITRWENKLAISWKKISKKLQEEVNLSIHELEEYMNDSSIVQLYMKSHIGEQAVFESQYITQKAMDPEVVQTIKKILSKFCSEKNITLLFSPYLKSLTKTFGSHLDKHYIICNSNFYNTENIKSFLSFIDSQKSLFHIIPINKKEKFRALDFSNMLLIGLLEAASHINHQSNLFIFILSNFNFKNKRTSPETIQLCWKYTEIRSLLEVSLQSYNPLETALFLALDENKPEKEISIFKRFTLDIKHCYSAESLQKFKEIREEIKNGFF